MKNGAIIHIFRGFVVESGEIQPAEVIVKDLVFDCLDVQTGAQTQCWHDKFYDVFRDLCLSCKSPCEAYAGENKPAYGKLVELKRIEDGDLLIQKRAAVQEELYQIYRKIPPSNCKHCGECCRLSVDLYSIEYINVLEYIRNNFSSSDLKRLKGLCQTELIVEKMGLDGKPRCIFRDEENKRCRINDIKPLPCRLYECEEAKHAGDSFCVQEKGPYKLVADLSDPLFVIRGEEIIISKKNEMNRWFLMGI